MHRLAASLLAVSLPLLAGCTATYLGSATSAAPAELRTDCGLTAVEGVPFVAQIGREDCGSAALAMIFAYWRIPVGREEVRVACPPTEGVGVRAVALRDLARAHELSAWIIRGEFADLEHELAHGRPLVVGLKQRWSDAEWTHYAVVVGVSRANDRVVTLDPARGWQNYTFGGFLDEWEPAGRLSMVFLRPSTRTTSNAVDMHSSEISP